MKYIVIAFAGIAGFLAEAVRPPQTHAATAAVEPSGSRRDLREREVRQIFDLMFAARTRTAIGILDSLAASCEGQPLYHLMRARAHRESLPVDDENKDRLKKFAVPLYEELDKTIDICTRRIESGEKDPTLYLYRGWAWMFRSHIHTFERSMWTAGKEAKRGKKDLEKYLSSRPNDPIAGSIMGAFLYFADTLPAAYRFVSKLLFLPGGDRDLGLQMMELSVGWDSVVEVDNRLILYSVDIGFEGRFEEGIEGFAALSRNHPRHSTFLRPAAVLMPLRPRYRESDGDRLDSQIDALASIPAGESEVATYWLLRFMQAWADRFYHPVRSAIRFESIIEANPESPDWVTSYSRFELARMLAAQARPEEAGRVLASLLDDPRGKYLHDAARDIRDHLDRAHPTAADADRVRDIYLSHDGATRALEYFSSVDEPGAATLFYLGEALLALDRDEEARAAYERATEADCERWDDSFRMIAAARAGEVAATQQDYEDAAAYYDKARSFWQKEFVYDWLLESRGRFFKRLAEGKERPPVTWFASSQ